MFEASAIEEVQQQENDARENPKGASNEKGVMIGKQYIFCSVHVSMLCCICEMLELFFFSKMISAQILRTYAATAQTRSHLAQASKTQKIRLFHDDTANQTDDDTANHLCKHDRKENESETNCGTSQQQTS
ncbi:hypothetical protein Tco_1048370, partial [Tanacetum coccineum]